MNFYSFFYRGASESSTTIGKAVSSTGDRISPSKSASLGRPSRPRTAPPNRAYSKSSRSESAHPVSDIGAFYRKDVTDAVVSSKKQPSTTTTTTPSAGIQDQNCYFYSICKKKMIIIIRKKRYSYLFPLVLLKCIKRNQQQIIINPQKTYFILYHSGLILHYNATQFAFFCISTSVKNMLQKFEVHFFLSTLHNLIIHKLHKRCQLKEVVQGEIFHEYKFQKGLPPSSTRFEKLRLCIPKKNYLHMQQQQLRKGWGGKQQHSSKLCGQRHHIYFPSQEVEPSLRPNAWPRDLHQPPRLHLQWLQVRHQCTKDLLNQDLRCSSLSKLRSNSLKNDKDPVSP